MLRETLGSRHPKHAHFHQQPRHAAGGQGQGDRAAAEPLCREALEVQRETLGNRHPDTLVSINNRRVLLMHRRLIKLAGSCLLTISCAAVCSAIVCMYLR